MRMVEHTEPVNSIDSAFNYCQKSIDDPILLACD
jgi:hypothetical protein